jgi:S-DNA-T family DNA segregation ATPase FtsK/SpoIIIE
MKLHLKIICYRNCTRRGFIEENLASKLVADFGLFDPTLDLSNYKYPTIDLLKEYSTGGITINQEELEENKTELLIPQKL